MRLQLETHAQKVQRLRQWHKKFLWLPHRVHDTGQYIWLETVWVRYLFHEAKSWYDGDSWEMQIDLSGDS